MIKLIASKSHIQLQSYALPRAHFQAQLMQRKRPCIPMLLYKGIVSPPVSIVSQRIDLQNRSNLYDSIIMRGRHNMKHSPVQRVDLASDCKSWTPTSRCQRTSGVSLGRGPWCTSTECDKTSPGSLAVSRRSVCYMMRFEAVGIYLRHERTGTTKQINIDQLLTYQVWKSSSQYYWVGWEKHTAASASQASASMSFTVSWPSSYSYSGGSCPNSQPDEIAKISTGWACIGTYLQFLAPFAQKLGSKPLWWVPKAYIKAPFR